MFSSFSCLLILWNEWAILYSKVYQPTNVPLVNWNANFSRQERNIQMIWIIDIVIYKFFFILLFYKVHQEYNALNSWGIYEMHIHIDSVKTHIIMNKTSIFTLPLGFKKWREKKVEKNVNPCKTKQFSNCCFEVKCSDEFSASLC